MRVPLASHFRHAPPPSHVSAGALRFGVMGGPVACIIAFLMNLIVLRERCDPEAVVTRVGLVVLALGVSVWALAVARRSWHLVREVEPGEGQLGGRNRFFAMLGIAASATGVVIALWFLAVVLVLDRCLRP